VSPFRTLLAELIAIGIPAAFLLIIYALDLYASRTFGSVMLCFAWGGVGGLALSYAFNTYVAIPLIELLALEYFLLYVVFAPVAEEVLKSLCLIYISQQAGFTYFVDGAVYGFAAGIGFSITENFLYMSYHPDLALPLMFVRSFSVCLMHGAASALVGVALGRFRFRRRSDQRLALLGGWAAAILLHMLFNSVSQSGFLSERAMLPLQIGIGWVGFGLTILFILLGLWEQRRWLSETLDRSVGMTDPELRATRSFGTLSFDEIMDPVFRQFPRQAERMESFVRNQAQIGIKRKVQQQAQDPKLKQGLERDLARLQERTGRLRQEMGMCANSYLQCVFPDDATDIWPCVEELVTCELPTGDEA